MPKQAKKPVEEVETPKGDTIVEDEESLRDIKENLGLPDKRLFRVEEVAAYFGVAVSTIYLWKDNGILDHERYRGVIRIPREAIIKCRLNAKVNSAK